jgi:broad specificity phosphatase PhoE
MAMPNRLVLVRHGRSVGNEAVDAEKRGDLSGYTEEFMTTPGHRWELTELGVAQARCAGAWIASDISASFARYMFSPYVRTRTTAGHLGLANARWRMNRALRERDWGDIGSMPRAMFRERYPDNAAMKDADPLYWVPPGGESIAGVAEDRVRNVCSTLHRECSGQTVVAVTHGEAMWAFRLVLERISDERFVAMDADPAEKIHNCEVLDYSRVDPVTGEVAPRLAWLRRAHPELDVDSGELRMVVGDWARFDTVTYSNEELLAGDVL